ncbi:hypothetical protein K2X83_00025, partial [Patescibacteria group bacterium]|nr:hypothetical protein [Patescibacteria group bacterium]
MDARAPIATPELWTGFEDSCTDPEARELRAQFEKLVKKRGFRPQDERRIAVAANLMQRMYEDVANRNDGAKPIVHILRVAIRVLSYGVKDPDVVIAALLHDAIEDHLEAFARLKKVSRKTIKITPHEVIFIKPWIMSERNVMVRLPISLS